MKWNFLYQITAASRTPDSGATAPISPFSLSSVLNWICWTPPSNKIPGYATDSIKQCGPPELTSIAVPFTIPMNNSVLKLCAQQSADFVWSSYEAYKYGLLAECMVSECETRRYVWSMKR